MRDINRGDHLRFLNDRGEHQYGRALSGVVDTPLCQIVFACSENDWEELSPRDATEVGTPWPAEAVDMVTPSAE